MAEVFGCVNDIFGLLGQSRAYEKCRSEEGQSLKLEGSMDRFHLNLVLSAFYLFLV